MIKAVIFDFGGVIIQEKSTVTGIIARMFNEPVEKVKEIARPMLLQMAVGKLDERDCWEAVSRSLGKPIPDNVENIWDDMTANSEDVYPEAIKLVEYVKSKNIKTIILSNSIEPFSRRNKQLLLYKDFDRVYLSCEIGFRKPDLEAYQYVLEKEGLQGEDCVFIDDKVVNLDPAKSLGMKTVWAQNTEQIRKDVLRLIQTGNK